ncbi:MAG: hypothetical protein ACXAD7_16425 [Candidatus Kariarchaeaceae archaeon]
MVSLRVSEELKNEMDKFTWINWSDILRTAIKDTVEKQDVKNIANAVLITERLRRKAPDEVNTTEIIRSWRNRDQ